MRGLKKGEHSTAVSTHARPESLAPVIVPALPEACEPTPAHAHCLPDSLRVQNNAAASDLATRRSPMRRDLEIPRGILRKIGSRDFDAPTVATSLHATRALRVDDRFWRIGAAFEWFLKLS